MDNIGVDKTQTHGPLYSLLPVYQSKVGQWGKLQFCFICRQESRFITVMVKDWVLLIIIEYKE